MHIVSQPGADQQVINSLKVDTEFGQRLQAAGVREVCVKGREVYVPWNCDLRTPEGAEVVLYAMRQNYVLRRE
jgi:hypothetical protein